MRTEVRVTPPAGAGAPSSPARTRRSGGPAADLPSTHGRGRHRVHGGPQPHRAAAARGRTSGRGAVPASAARLDASGTYSGPPAPARELYGVRCVCSACESTESSRRCTGPWWTRALGRRQGPPGPRSTDHTHRGRTVSTDVTPHALPPPRHGPARAAAAHPAWASRSPRRRGQPARVRTAGERARPGSQPLALGAALTAYAVGMKHSLPTGPHRRSTTPPKVRLLEASTRERASHSAGPLPGGHAGRVMVVAGCS
ncbi:hypothetical protein QJS66_12605 [Kocuria rhizophila]|nr:hypothetical protein QJS66_12605 [Kocuria rhizophila]